LPRCRSLIPGTGTPYGVTHDKMSLPDAIDVPDGRLVHGAVDQRHWWKEGKDNGCRGEGRRPRVAGDVLVLLTKRAADLPLDDRIHEQAHHRAPGSGRHPCGFLPPPRAEGGGILAPAPPWFHGAMWRLIGLE
jgi:hypothetical protein